MLQAAFFASTVASCVPPFRKTVQILLAFVRLLEAPACHGPRLSEALSTCLAKGVDLRVGELSET